MEKIRCQICGKELSGSFFKVTKDNEVFGCCLDCFNKAREDAGKPKLSEKEFNEGLEEDKKRHAKKIANFKAAYEKQRQFMESYFPETYENVKDSMQYLLEYNTEDCQWIESLIQLWIIMAKASNMDKIQENSTIHRIPEWCGKFVNMFASKIDRLKLLESL